MICGDSTACKPHVFNETLTLEKLHETIKLLRDAPPQLFIAYSWIVPYDKVYQGDMIDKIIKLMHPGFNPKVQKGFLVSERWRRDIKETENGLWKA